MVSSVDINTSKKIRNNSSATSPIVMGNFPVFENFKELAIFKLNRLLSFILIFTVIVSMVCYSAVIAKESYIAQINKKTNEINYENIELQNRVDIAKSFYNIKSQVSRTKFLTKPNHVMEVRTVIPDILIEDGSDKFNVKTVAGY